MSLRELIKELEPRKQSIRGKKELVIIDDNTEIRYMFEKTFQALGYKTYSYRTAEEALKGMKSNPSAIIMDILLPDAHGTELYLKLREVAPGAPIVIFSAYVGPDFTKEKIEELNPCAFIRKRGVESVEELVKTIRRTVND